MSDIHAAPDAGAGAEPAISVVTPASDKPTLSASEAARFLAQHRAEARKKPIQQAEPAARTDAQPVAVPEQDSAAQADDAAPPQEEVPGETTETVDPAAEQQPPIEPPRSWTKEARERWSALPRETQEYLATREQERDREVRRSQNEAAEHRKAIEAERASVEKAREQYEQAVPMILQALQDQTAGEFADIKTMADVDRLAREDWPRYVQWDAHQKKVAAVQTELKAIADRKAQEQHVQWNEFAQKEDSLFAEKASELADPVKAKAFQEKAVSVLSDTYGIPQQELVALWNGQKPLSIRDHRVQLLLRDAVRYQDAQKAAKKTAAKPLPPVQRPGVSSSATSQKDAQIQALTKRLDQTGSMKDAAALIAARRAGR